MKTKGLSQKMAMWVLVISGAVASGGAGAVDNTFEVGTIYSGTPFTDLVEHTTATEPVGTFFTDSFNFQIGDGVAASSVVVDLELAPYLNIDGLHIWLFSGTDAALGELLSDPVGADTTLTVSLMTNTDYTLIVSGTTSGILGGAYSTAIAVDGMASAVPEAESWVMMVAGLGMVGFALRRSSRRQVTQIGAAA